MKVIVCKDYEEMSWQALEIIKQELLKRPDSLVSFPGGDTPLGTIKKFVSAVNCGDIKIDRAKFVSLDEWVGLGKEVYGSCQYFLNESLFKPLKYSFAETFIINGAADDIEQEREAHEKFVEKYGPIAVSLLGIGLNGHIGFNEDGVDFSLNTHITPLSEKTKEVMGKYFNTEHKLTHGITLGINQIMEANVVIVIANGSHKAQIVREALQGEVTNRVPASILQNHPNCYFVLDQTAASNL